MGTPAENLSTRVKNTLEHMVGQRAVRGSRRSGGFGCFALVNKVLKSVSAKTAADFGRITPNGDYVWGTPVNLGSVKPGDVLQFSNHVILVRTDYADGSMEERSYSRGHHSAVVVEVQKDGSVYVVEQNVRPKPRRITRNLLVRLPKGKETRRSDGKKVTITVTGTVKAYRPVPKSHGASLLRPDDSVVAGKRRMLAYAIPADQGIKRRPGPIVDTSV